MTDQIREVGDHWQVLVNDELERDRGQEQDEGQLESRLGNVVTDGKRGEGETADEELGKIIIIIM